MGKVGASEDVGMADGGRNSRSSVGEREAAVQLSRIPAMYNFEDSNSDTGGISAALQPISWPYGQTFKKPSGRDSDGRLLVDFIGMLSAAHFEKSILPRPEDFSNGLYAFDIGLNDLSVGFHTMNNKQLRIAIIDIVSNSLQPCKQVQRVPVQFHKTIYASHITIRVLVLIDPLIINPLPCDHDTMSKTQTISFSLKLTSPSKANVLLPHTVLLLNNLKLANHRCIKKSL